MPARRWALLYWAVLACHGRTCVSGAGLLATWFGGVFSPPPASTPSPAGSAAASDSWHVSAIRVDAGPLDRTSLDPSQVNTSDFVKVSGKRFIIGCRTFVPFGVNSFTMIEQAAQLPCGSYGADYSQYGRAQVTVMLDDAVKRGLNFVRLWAFTVTTTYPLQLAPSVYDDNIFRGLDYILAAAHKRGLRVVLVLSDWWTTPGGVSQYVSWSDSAHSAEDFFADTKCKEHFKRNALNMIMRTNSVNGRRYRDDPTIMSWELMNEPRCRGCGMRLQAWIAEMAGFLALHDPHHLRTVGEEGFFAYGGQVNANPATWARHTGQDFRSNHDIDAITHTACHVWPTNWAILGGTSGIAPTQFVSSWLTAHFTEADRLDKPLILEEYGHALLDFTLVTRETFYSQVLQATSLAGCGSAFWTWYNEDDRSHTAADQYAVFSDDAVWSQLSTHARMFAERAETVCSEPVRRGGPRL